MSDRKLYLLRRDYDHYGYDEYDAAVIRATSEDEARLLAVEHLSTWGGPQDDWLDATCTCVEVTQEGDTGVVLGSFNAG